MSKKELNSLGERETRRKSIVAEMMAASSAPVESEAAGHPGTERKSRRKQILLRPSVHDLAEEKCRRLGVSMNEVVNQLLVEWLVR